MSWPNVLVACLGGHLVVAVSWRPLAILIGPLVEQAAAVCARHGDPTSAPDRNGVALA